MTLEQNTYVKERFSERYGVELRALKESKTPGTKMPDFELFSGGKREAVLEVKRLESTPRTEANGWRVTQLSACVQRAVRAKDNGPSRVIHRIREGSKQLNGFDEPKILVFVNDEELLDVHDFDEAFRGSLVYRTDETGYYENTASKRLSDARIGREKLTIDLYIWIDRRRAGAIRFRPTSERGRNLQRRFFAPTALETGRVRGTVPGG